MLIEGVSIVFHFSCSLFFHLFDIKLLFHRLSLLRLFRSTLLILTLFRLSCGRLILGRSWCWCFLWLWCFDLFSPFFNEHAITESNQTIFSIFQLELDSKSFLLWILRFSDIISNVFVEARNRWIVLNQNLNCFFSSKFDCFT